MDSFNAKSTKPLYRGTQIVWYILGVFEAVLAVRFFLKLLAANPNAGFTHFIYTISYPLAAPFLGVFRASRIVSGSIFEWTTLLAMVVYWLVAIGIIRLFLMSKSVSTPEAAIKLEEQEN
jgi:hypothetical protein